MTDELKQAVERYRVADTGQAVAWHYEIQHGPDGETNYSWLYEGKRMVATLKTFDAIKICNAFAVCEKIASHPARVDVERIREDRDFWKSSFQTETRARIELQERLTDVEASLVAAVSLLKRGSKKAAPSDKIFDQMIADYEGSIERARAALRKQEKGG